MLSAIIVAAGASERMGFDKLFAPLGDKPVIAHTIDAFERTSCVGEIVLVHRVGHLAVGEVSVAVAVSCPHRGQAFEACRYAIDRLKELVPIWKKENWADGTTEWVHPGTGEAR